jgi:hypothetical protein
MRHAPIATTDAMTGMKAIGRECMISPLLRGTANAPAHAKIEMARLAGQIKKTRRAMEPGAF